MKNLRVEEKVKAHDKFVEELKSKFKDFQVIIYNKNDLEKFFPELRESEDEKIRKELLNAFQESEDSLYMVLTPHRRESFVAWLEKQNSNVDNANKEYWKGYREGKQEILDKYAELEKQGEQDMIPLDKMIKFLDDQLVNDKDEATGEPFINFQNYGAFKESFISYFKRKMLEKQGEPIDKIVKRAMNEKQRVLLTETNGDANIDWDTRSIQDVKLLLEYGLDYIKKLEKQGEQKPAEEYNITGISSNKSQGKLGEIIKNLKLTWSEWDETMITDLSVIVHTYFSEISGIPFKYDLSEDKIRTWLKSLKEKYTWEPSDEQMAELRKYSDNPILRNLYYNLKKLKG